MIDIRPFHPTDWGVLLDLANQAVPFAPQENAEWLEYRKAFDESRRVRRHYLAVDSDRPVGYGGLEQQGDAPDSLRVYVVASPAHLHGEVGARLYARLLQDTQELRTTHLWAREFQSDAQARAFFLSHGFAESEPFVPPGQKPIVVFNLHLAA